ncbi:hypothetical protein [Wenxinia marina]|uniref:Glyceraldehyde-3-phosphate dehydrogenase n=1 Tax=Wenxinia marina DSM 24838 TaxID=1123501 RepID=A0A0D0NNU5_9RHOB|nr:hypothetical protein [Wenxinia marina]KIQ69960.1 hypothetical protein Wenmar_01530 [Wenxinia marina DSM 24838]GGL62445.1 hypothetical protein GCM10011392_16340 [Wenxinia marina]
MTTRLALLLFLALALLVALDIWMGWGGTLFAARRFTDLIRSLAFWR